MQIGPCRPGFQKATEVFIKAGYIRKLPSYGNVIGGQTGKIRSGVCGEIFKKHFREPVSHSHGLPEKPGDRSGADAPVPGRTG